MYVFFKVQERCIKCGQSAAYNIRRTKNTLFGHFYGSNGHLIPRTQNSALIEHVMGSGDPECSFTHSALFKHSIIRH